MANTTILSWNVCGLNAQARRDNVRTLTEDLKPSIVCLQETKLDVISEYTIFSLLGRDFAEFAYVPASSTRGGILIAGRRSSVVLSDVLLGCFSITVAVRPASSTANDDAKWWLSSVYGPSEDGDKSIFLEELEAIREDCTGPWTVTGDFNLILSEQDKNNDRVDRANMRRFRQMAHALGLHDLNLHG